MGGGGGAFLGATNSDSSSGLAEFGRLGLLIGNPSADRVFVTPEAIGLEIVLPAIESFRAKGEFDSLRSCCTSALPLGTSFLDITLFSESSLAGLSNADP